MLKLMRDTRRRMRLYPYATGPNKPKPKNTPFDQSVSPHECYYILYGNDGTELGETPGNDLDNRLYDTIKKRTKEEGRPVYLVCFLSKPSNHERMSVSLAVRKRKGKPQRKPLKGKYKCCRYNRKSNIGKTLFDLVYSNDSLTYYKTK